MDLRNHYIHFKVADVYIPDPRNLLWHLHGNDLLRGRVVDLSDSGAQEQAFAVVEVEGIEQPMIVPVDRIVEISD